MTGKERCLAMIRGEPVDRVPVFPLLMFFAQQRLGVTYREFASNGRVTAEAQIAMFTRFGVDAITACTDAYRLVADLGARMVFPEDKPPFAEAPLVHSRADLHRLPKPDPTEAGSRMADRCQACTEMVRYAGKDALILGWVDMPFAEACSLCGLSEFMVMLYDSPALAHEVLEFLTQRVIEFALAQLATGIDGVGAGDAAASLVSAPHYREFAQPYERRVVEAVHRARKLLKLHICGNTTALLDDMAAVGADLYNVDHLVDLRAARTAYDGRGLCYKGNLDPVADLLQATPQHCLDRCRDCLETARGSRYMLSPGCEIPAATPDEVFAVFCDAPLLG
jgi:MtaA/CmuA family methyltransferase